MAMQTIFFDSEGWVRCVEDGESDASVHGCEKALSDTDVHGELTLRHTVTVSDGKVTDAIYHEPPGPTDAQWYKMIEHRADEELGRGVSYTDADGNSYTIRTGPSARSLIAGAHSATERADRLGESITRKIPTQNAGVVNFGNADIVGIFEQVEVLHQGTADKKGIMDRVDELNAKVADGTITESDLDEGWPA